MLQCWSFIEHHFVAAGCTIRASHWRPACEVLCLILYCRKLHAIILGKRKGATSLSGMITFPLPLDPREAERLLYKATPSHPSPVSTAPPLELTRCPVTRYQTA